MNININSLEADAALALDPLHLPGSTQNVQPPGYAHLGVPQSIYPAPPPAPAGLAIVIDPWTMLAGSPKGALGGVFAAYDSVKVWLNGIATSTGATVLPGDETKRILLYLPLGLLRDGINKMSYRVERLGGNYEDSRILDVLYNNPASGIAVSHPPSIAPGQPATFTLTRNYPREYDVMTLIIGTWSKTIPYVHPANPVTYTLTTTDLQQIGDGTHPVSATVVDQLSNSNASPTTSITITANQKVYNPPIIVEAEANNRVLNVVALNGQNATIHVLTWTGMVDDQPCWLKLLGFKADGSAHDLQLWNGLPARTNPTWISQGKYVQTVLNSYLAQLGDGRTLTVQFWVSEDKSNNFATATKFADQVYTVKALAAVVITFLNAPYSATAGGQVAGIELLVTQTGQPDAGKAVAVTLPLGTTFADGTNVGNFVTGSDGKVRLVGVTASSVAGTSSITAVSGGSTASAVLTITAQAPLGPIAVSPAPFGVTYSSDGKLAYVTGAKLVQVIDTTRSTLIKQIPLPSLDVSWEIALNQNASRAFACNGNNALSVIDTNTNSLIANLPAAGHPIGVVLSRDGSQAFVSTWQTNTVVVFDLVNLRAVKTIAVGSYARGIDISRDGQRVYVANYANGAPSTVSVIATSTLSVVRTVPMSVSAYGVAASPDGNSFFVCGINSSGQGFVLQFSTQTWTQIRSTGVIGYPRGIVVNHAGTRAYCCDRDTNTVSTINIASGQVIATTTVGQGPLEIAISPDDSRALVTCVYDNTVWAISLLPGAASQGASGVGVSGVTSTSSQSRAPLPGDAY